MGLETFIQNNKINSSFVTIGLIVIW